MQYIFYILSVPFLYINYKIVVSDLQYKKIPNKYLGYLLLLIPFWWATLFFGAAPNYLPSASEISPITFGTQIMITFLISFMLYYFGIWAAGDAKYLLVLSLFIPYIGVIPFIGNIALITIGYLLVYFIWFWLGRVLFNRIYRKKLLSNIKQDIFETWKIHKGNKGGDTLKIISKFLLIFFVVFVSIRLSRIYLFNNFIENGDNISYLSTIIEKHSIYIIFLLIGAFLGSLYLIRLIVNKTKALISSKLKLELELIGNVFIGALVIILFSFISYELLNNFNEITTLLYQIVTLYLVLYGITKVLIYSYKITFGIGETYYKDISHLEEGDIVDKAFIINSFKLDTYLKDSGIDLSQIEKSLDQNQKKSLQSLYRNYNSFHLKNKTPKFHPFETIKILKTSPFGWFILTGFLTTLSIGNKAFLHIVGIMKNLMFYIVF